MPPRPRRMERRRRWPLRFRFVSDETNDKYFAWVVFYMRWCRDDGRDITDGGTLDENVTACVEHMYMDDYPVVYAGYLLSGMQHFLGLAPWRLKLAWRTFGAWKREQPTASAPPLPQIVLRAVVVVCANFGLHRLGALLALAFHAYLRTSEFLDLRAEDLLLDGQRGSVRLWHTKTSRRVGGYESVVIDCPVTIVYLRRALSEMQPGESFWPYSVVLFRRVWVGILTLVGCQNMRLSPYSIRRGGASEDFARCGSLGRCMIRGRWRHLKTAKVYLQVARTVETTLQLPSEAALRCTHLAALFPLTDLF